MDIMVNGEPTAVVKTLSNESTDGSITISATDTVVTLFDGVTPPNGFMLFNPNPLDRLFFREGGDVEAYKAGSHVLEMCGMFASSYTAQVSMYRTHPNEKPLGPITVIWPSGQNGASSEVYLTAKMW